jgi:hypothetical protein
VSYSSGGPAFFVSIYKTIPVEGRRRKMIRFAALNRHPGKHANPEHQLFGLAVLLAAMYVCSRTLRFTNDWFNLAFLVLFLIVPLLAIPFVLRLPRESKVWGAVLLAPMVAFSLLGFPVVLIFDIPALVEHRELSRELGTVQQGRYSVLLLWEKTAGGALGPHGVGLQQRMPLFPGLYAKKSLDFFEGAFEGSISSAGPDRIKLHIPDNGRHQQVDRVYSLKPWLYF